MCWFENDIGISVIMCELNKMQETKSTKSFSLSLFLFIWLFGVRVAPDWMSHTSRNEAEAKFVHIYCDTWQLAYTFLPFFSYVFAFHSVSSTLPSSIGLAHGLAYAQFFFFFCVETLHGFVAALRRAIHVSPCFVCSNLATVAPWIVYSSQDCTRYRQIDTQSQVVDGASEVVCDKQCWCLFQVHVFDARINIFTCFYTLHHFQIPKLRGLWVMTL